MKKCQVHDFEQILKQTGEVQTVDVRESAEYASERLAGTISIPLSNMDEAAVTRLNKEKPVYLLCRSGNRACQAAEKLERLGFSDLYVVEGGLSAWMQSGKSVEKGSSRIWSLERQVRFAAGAMVLAGIGLSYILHPAWIGLSLFVAAGLIFSAVTDTCGMAMMLAKCPWNQAKECRR